LLPDGGSTWFLPRLVGEQRARALAMLAPQITAQQAKDWGLIWDVVEDGELIKTATELARRLADGPTLSLARIKQALGRASGNDLGQQLDIERDFQRELGRSEDFKEGVAAFLAKRKPIFKGQ
jgi:2-(1,2-epoxy-1,2-dihydrophenyl)acetyl-CoA isomerase